MLRDRCFNIKKFEAWSIQHVEHSLNKEAHEAMSENFRRHGAQDMRNVECVKEIMNFHVEEYCFMCFENDAGMITSMRSFYQLKSAFLAHHHHQNKQ